MSEQASPTHPSGELLEEIASNLHEKVKGIRTRWECDLVAPIIAEIRRLKDEKNAVILAHNYMVPEIYHGIADFCGDSLGLSKEAANTDADIIVFCGVHFMAETAKILNPEKKVLLPSMDAGCSLAESITAEDVRKLKEKYPGVPVVTYINTSAAVKAETDVCCTSGNALEVAESLDSDRILFIPDQYLTTNIQAQTTKELIDWKGSCMVHELFTVEDIQSHRKMHPGLFVLAHPECPPEVIEEADFSGSTYAMVNKLNDIEADRVMMVTECSMADNVRELHPEKEFISTCVTCPHMKRITPEAVLECLKNESPEINVPEDIRIKAKNSLDRMLEIGRGPKG